MKKPPLNIAFFGSSFVSAYKPEAYNQLLGIIKAMAGIGYKTTYYEPDDKHNVYSKEISQHNYATWVYYSPDPKTIAHLIDRSSLYEIIVKVSGDGVLDEYLVKQLLMHRRINQQIIYWDMNPSITLNRIVDNVTDPLRKLINQFNLIITNGGGKSVINLYEALGAKKCLPVNNGFDIENHHPAKRNANYDCDLALFADHDYVSEEMVQEYFVKPAAACPDKSLLLVGAGWDYYPLPKNVKIITDLSACDCNTLNTSARSILHIPESFPSICGSTVQATLFEAAAAGACIISCQKEEIQTFLEPDKEYIYVKSGNDVIEILKSKDEKNLRRTGNAGMRKMLAEHTFTHRAKQISSHFLNLSPAQ